MNYLCAWARNNNLRENKKTNKKTPTRPNYPLWLFLSKESLFCILLTNCLSSKAYNFLGIAAKKPFFVFTEILSFASWFFIHAGRDEGHVTSPISLLSLCLWGECTYTTASWKAPLIKITWYCGALRTWGLNYPHRHVHSFQEGVEN